MNVIQDAYVNGVSTRKIEKLAKSLGIDSISLGQVSQIIKESLPETPSYGLMHYMRRLDMIGM